LIQDTKVRACCGFGGGGDWVFVALNLVGQLLLHTLADTVQVSAVQITNKNYYQHVLQIGANEASAQGLLNYLKKECGVRSMHYGYSKIAIWHLEIANLYGGCMEPGCIQL
jgi:hypothetical protein